MPAKQFAVLGLGRFGASVGRVLSEMGYEVLGVDSDEDKVNDMSSVLTQAVVADGTDEAALQSLGVRNLDCVVVAVGDLQASILMTVVLKEMGVKEVVAKASSDLHGRVLTKVGADRVVFPEREMGARVAQNLASANIIDFIELAPDFSIAEVSATGTLVGKSLRQLSLRQRFGVNVVAIKSGSDINVSPKADDVIQEHDVLVVIGENQCIRHLERQ
ncbi:MAG: TrkA family potassium uptake protein [Bacillota bacterium]|nr:TrkA family potassium uptake protein [Bacillota bacterium]